MIIRPHRIFFYMAFSSATVAIASSAWAQNTDLPALPPDAQATISLPPPPPVVENTAQQPVVVPQAEVPPANAQPQVSEAEAPPVTTQTEMVVAPQPVEQQQAPASANIPPAADEKQPEAKENFTPSYGTFEQSLFLSAQEADTMKKLLFAYESIQRPEGPVATPKDDLTALIEAPITTIQEPANYPTYYLSSIAYRSAKDWLFWMNGAKYGPKRMPGGLRVLSMSPRGALFEWKPEYIGQAKTRYENNLVDTSIPKHIKASNSYVKYDEKNDRFTVMIAPNQSFVSASFGVYEGKHADKPVPEMVQEVQVNAVLNDAPPPPPQPFKDPDAALKATMGDLQKFGSNVGQFAPRNNPNAPTTSSSSTPTEEPTPVQSVPSLPVLQRAQ